MFPHARTGEKLGITPIDKTFKHSVFFGINLVPDKALDGAAAVISVGDSVQPQVRGAGSWLEKKP